MAERSHLLIFLLLFCGFVTSKLTHELSDSTKNCENSCLKTFPTDKSNSVEKLSDACQRGCRFFMLVNSVTPVIIPVSETKPIVKLPASPNDIPQTKGEVNKKGEDSDNSESNEVTKPTSEPVPSAKTNSSKEACQASCMEAYRHTRERYACHEGCTHMARETAREEERFRQAALEEGARELASLAAVAPIISSMLNQMYSAVGNPQPRFTVVVEKLEDSEVPHNEDVFWLDQPQDQTLFLQAIDSEPDDVLTDPTLIRQLESSSSLDISLRLPEQRVRTFPASEHAPRFTPPHQPAPAHTAPGDLLACLSTRYGVPKWLLGFLALVTGILTAWLCLEPWDRAAILEENTEKQCIVDMEDEDYEKTPLSIETNDMVKIPLESTKA